MCVQVSATEADAGGVVEYSIVTGPTNRFQIDMATGLITTVIPLDREEQDRYILTVSARDMGDVVLETFTQVRGGRGRGGGKSDIIDIIMT